MSNRRIQLSDIALSGDKPFGAAEGLAGEDFDTEVLQLHGFSSTPAEPAESILLEQNDDADNMVALPPMAERVAEPEQTIIYYGSTVITLEEGKVIIDVGGNNVTIENGTLETDLDIVTSGNIEANEVTAQGVNLSDHIHTGVQAGMGVSGEPQ